MAPRSLVYVGIAALGVGVLVYQTDRVPGSAMLIPSAMLLEHIGVFGSAGQWLPSFVHPFAFSLFTAAVLPASLRWGGGACVVWCAVNVGFEIGQHPAVSAGLAEFILDGFGSTASTRALAGYFLHGTFDQGDIAAAVVGALAAACLLLFTNQPLEAKHEQASA